MPSTRDYESLKSGPTPHHRQVAMRPPRTKETSLEARFRKALESLGVGFYANYTGFQVVQPDFWLPQYKAVVEVDGLYWHSKQKQRRRDRKKDDFYRANGLRIFRFTEADVKANAPACASYMLCQLTGSLPPQEPLSGQPMRVPGVTPGCEAPNPQRR